MPVYWCLQNQEAIYDKCGGVLDEATCVEVAKLFIREVTMHDLNFQGLDETMQRLMSALKLNSYAYLLQKGLRYSW